MHRFFCICLDNLSVAQGKGIKKLITIILNFISYQPFPIPNVFHFANCFAWIWPAQPLQFLTEFIEPTTPAGLSGHSFVAKVLLTPLKHYLFTFLKE